jgi:hypothetical protein
LNSGIDKSADCLSKHLKKQAKDLVKEDEVPTASLKHTKSNKKHT